MATMKTMAMWQRADVELAASKARETAELAAQLGWLEVARREGTHVKLGFAKFYEYVRSRLGLGARAAFDRIRIARALTELQRTRDALASGRLTMCGVRELTRVMLPETETAWLEAAVGQPIHVIETLVRGRGPGDLPITPVDPEKLTIERRFELRNQTDALLRQVRLMLEQSLGTTLSDDELLHELATRQIAALQEGATSRDIQKKVVVNFCPECDSVHQLAAGRWVRIDPADLGPIDASNAIYLHEELDAHVGSVADGDDVPLPVRRAVYLRDQGCCTVPGCAGTHYLHWHHIIHREHRGPHEPWNITLWCSAHHRAYHKGRLVVDGNRAGGLTYFHSDGSRYGHLPEAAEAAH